MKAMASLGLKIRRAMEANGMTQEQLAKEVNKSVRAVNDWINDRRKPRSSIGLLEKVLQADLTSDDVPSPDLATWEEELQDELDKLSLRAQQIEADLRKIRRQREGPAGGRRVSDDTRAANAEGFSPGEACA